MNNIEFNTDKDGIIKIDKVLFESHYPILFTCKNNIEKLFLAVCYELNDTKQSWLISYVKAETIIKLLSDEITIRDAFLEDDGNRYEVSVKGGNYNIEKVSISSWKDKENYKLPTEGEFMDVEEDEFIDEINYFKSLIEVKFNHFTNKMYKINISGKSIGIKILDNRYFNKNIDLGKVKNINYTQYKFNSTKNIYYKNDFSLSKESGNEFCYSENKLIEIA